MAFCTNCGKELLDSFEFCPECGKKIDYEKSESYDTKESFYDFTGMTKICPKCDAAMPEDSFYCLNCGGAFPDRNIEFETIKRRITIQAGTWRSKWIALILCVFFGWLGVHRFYEGKVITGLLYLCTLGFFGIGWIVDIVRLAMKPNPYRVK